MAERDAGYAQPHTPTDAKKEELSMTSEVIDVLKTVQSFIAKGYDREYRIKGGHLVDFELGSALDPCTIQVDAALRLVSGDGVEDATNIYAITDPKSQHKGLLIDAIDLFDELCHHDLSERLVPHRETVPAGDQDVPSKHGMRKVYKNEFDRDPERYILREGFPDFPACPFGGDFSILGFDTTEQSYVWLVTSIIRDSRLIRIPYQGEDVISDEYGVGESRFPPKAVTNLPTGHFNYRNTTR